MQVPHAFQQHGARDDLAGMAQEVLEQLELFCCEIDGAACTCDAPGEQIELEIGKLELGDF